MAVKIGIIGGSGFYNLAELEDPISREIDTEFGKPSDVLMEGKVGGVPCVVLARHGRHHTVPPTDVNYRANIWAMKSLGVTHILAATACGSLKEDFHPGDFVLLDSFIDRTTKREQSFHNSKSTLEFGRVCHIPMHPTFCEATRNVIVKAAENVSLSNFHKNGTMVTIEGPRFSTRAESIMFKSFGGDVINMTTVPEAPLAKEAGISYASVAMVTDYDCWKVDTEPVTVAQVMAVLSKNVENVRKLFIETIALMSNENWTPIIKSNQEISAASVVRV